MYIGDWSSDVCSSDLLPLTRLEDDDEATGIAAEVMRVLWRPVPATHSFITVARRPAAFARVREMHGGSAGPGSEERRVGKECDGRGAQQQAQVQSARD